MSKTISILGASQELIPVQRGKLRGLNADMLLRFSFYTIDFNHQILCVIQVKNEQETITPLKYKKITQQVENVMSMPVVVLLGSLPYYERERLISQGVYFIISDKYAFLPSLIANIQAKRREKKTQPKLTPAAQYVLLYYLLKENSENEFTIKRLEELVPYNYVTLARAITSLEDCQLCTAEIRDSGIKYICFKDSKRELWLRAQNYLSSPTKKVLYCDSIPEGNFSISGVNALSHYSHLNPEQYGAMAIWDKQFSSEDGHYNEIEGLYKIEIWRYPATIPYDSNGGIVDKLSLYLAMKNEPDSRIEKELEIMIEEMKW
ncbi:hypothetical protein [Bacteroides sp. 51]|uniref:hypothetical protein n=1 Tax=Bacteroides sp. 51 TaxID=2302938 RepID=UPI0013D53463|nr:hypothetical protein [Bacteroides sp. 51]NDV84059.1 hypothetical protein [Bacteroides sp. 51]